jgi:phosphoadenosine phosphosulfate reductase
MVGGAHVDVDSAQISALAAEFESAPPETVFSWVNERFARRASVVCSFQDCVLVDLAVRCDPGIEVIFLDTGSHFPETLGFVEEVRALYGLNLRVVSPGPEAHAWPCGTDRCCELRKVRPLDEALQGRDAWITGLKRCDSPDRAGTPVVSLDHARGLVKVNPLARWSDEDVAEYLTDHALPVHPLVEKGYLSIGCAPTTRPVVPGEDPRAGRWPGTSKTECGLHT